MKRTRKTMESSRDNWFDIPDAKFIYNEDWEGRGLEEEVLDMPDRAEELEREIEKLWVRLGYLPGDKNEVVLDLISKYVELEQIEPGRVDF